MPKRTPPRTPPPSLEELALLIAVNCVRNTVIENYHSEGKLSDPDMKAFNIEVANNLFTFLSVLMLDEYDDVRSEFLALMNFSYPHNWNRPELDDGFVKTIDAIRRRHATGKWEF